MEVSCGICFNKYDNYEALRNHYAFTHYSYDGTAVTDMRILDGQDNRFVLLSNKTNDVVRSVCLAKVKDVGAQPATSKRTNGLNRKRQEQEIKLSGPFKCIMPSVDHPELICQEEFYDCCIYSLHYRDKHTKRRKAALRCQVCEKPLDNQNIQSEFNINEINVYSCHICSLTFFNDAERKRHIKSVHAKIKPYECCVCEKRFSQHGGLQQHMRVHTGFKPFTCTVCQKSFTQKAGLNQHFRTHTKKKPFSCIVCYKKFSQLVHVRQHMRTHTNIQPFECTNCGRRFKQSSHLNLHMKSHNDTSSGIHSLLAAVTQSTSPDILKFTIVPVINGETTYYSAVFQPDLNTDGSHPAN